MPIMIFSKINPNPPEESLIHYELDIENGLKELLEFNYKKKGEVYLYQKIHRIAISTQLHYIFGKWEKLNNIFAKHKLLKLFEFLHEFNTRVEWIATGYDDLDAMENDILNFAIELNNYNYFNFIM